MKKWNLNSLYLSFDDKAIQDDFTNLKNYIDEAHKILKRKTKDVDAIIDFYDVYNKILATSSKISSFGNLCYAANTADEKAIKLIEKIEKYEPIINDLQVNFSKFLIDLEGKVLNDERLNVYKFDISNYLENARYILSDEKEETILSMRTTGSSAFSKLHDYSVSALMCDYDGKKEPISNIRNLAYHKDSKVRKAAYESELKALSTIDYVNAAALNAIKGEVIYESNLRGYSSPIEMTLIKSRMTDATLKSLIMAIESYLPHFHRYLKAKAKVLGHEGSLPFYDLFAPISESDLKFSYDEAKDYIVGHFSTFNENLGNFAKRAFDNDWIDPFPRKGKVSGAFCQNLPYIKESRILTNFTGTFNDVSTLAHELGHGYHGECLHKNEQVNTDYPMPLAETASIFCETIIQNAALKTANKSDKLTILESSISNATQVVVDIYSRYLFEKELFEKRKNGSLSVNELNEIMLKAQKQAYGDGLDENYLHKYMWVIKPHYYFRDYNFYNFPYAFGLLFAKGLYSMYLKEGETFLPKYDKLLNYTGDHDIKEVLASVDINSESVEFFESSLELIKKDIDDFIEVCNENK